MKERFLIILIFLVGLLGFLAYFLKPQTITKEEVTETIVKEVIVEVHKCDVLKDYIQSWICHTKEVCKDGIKKFEVVSVDVRYHPKFECK